MVINLFHAYSQVGLAFFALNVKPEKHPIDGVRNYVPFCMNDGVILFLFAGWLRDIAGKNKTKHTSRSNVRVLKRANATEDIEFNLHLFWADRDVLNCFVLGSYTFAKVDFVLCGKNNFHSTSFIFIVGYL